MKYIILLIPIVQGFVAPSLFYSQNPSLGRNYLNFLKGGKENKPKSSSVTKNSHEHDNDVSSTKSPTEHDDEGYLADMFHPEMQKGGKDFPFKNNSEIINSPPDDDDEWEQTRPLPRSKVLIFAYFKMHDVVPEVIPRAPKAAIEVMYENNNDTIADFGNELTQDMVAKIPTNTTWPVEKGAYYSLIFFTPDYPERFDQSDGQFLLWFVANINSSCLAKSGTTYAEYLSPKARSKNRAILGELRRFIYLVYKQPEKSISYTIETSSKNPLESRKHFNVTELARSYNLSEPVAGNMFQLVTFNQI